MSAQHFPFIQSHSLATRNSNRVSAYETCEFNLRVFAIFRFAFPGNKIEIKNHYRGHKLSMWLSLIPQLHMPGDLTELAMRHHHFAETDKRFYDGKWSVKKKKKNRKSI